MMDLVTGGLGFIGNELVRQLKVEGHDMAVLDSRCRVAPQIEDIADVAAHEADLTDTERVKEVVDRKADKQVQMTDLDHLGTLTGWRPQRERQDGLAELLRFEGLLASAA